MGKGWETIERATEEGREVGLERRAHERLRLLGQSCLERLLVLVVLTEVEAVEFELLEHGLRPGWRGAFLLQPRPAPHCCLASGRKVGVAFGGCCGGGCWLFQHFPDVFVQQWVNCRFRRWVVWLVQLRLSDGGDYVGVEGDWLNGLVACEVSNVQLLGPHPLLQQFP